MAKKYNEIEVKNNMVVDNEPEVVEQETQVSEKPKLQQVVAVQPKKVKRSLFGRLITGVMGPEGLPGIGTYVNEEIIKPAIKNLIYDTITSAASRAMYGRTGGPSRPSNGYTNYNRSSGGRTATPYNSRYNGSPSRNDATEERRTVRPGRYGVDEYKIPDRYEAAHVLTSLRESADRYNTVSVADYYDLIGVESQFTDNAYGWTIDTITRATIMPVHGGFIIKFPPVEVIN